MRFRSSLSQHASSRRPQFRLIHLFALVTLVAVYLGVEMALERAYFGRPVWVFLPVLVLPVFWDTVCRLIWGRRATWIGAMIGLLTAAMFASDWIAAPQPVMRGGLCYLRESRRLLLGR